MKAVLPISEIWPQRCGHHGLSRYLLNWDRSLVLYRYISWFLTSAFSFIGSMDSPLVFKVCIALILLLAGQVAVYLYQYNKEKPGRILGLVMIETVGIAFLLIPTGGLDSPFMWYALNPIFIAASLAPAISCWGVLAFFLAAATAGSMLFNGQVNSVFIVWQEQLWLLLVFLLLTTAVQLFARLVQQLTSAYEQLSAAHKETQQSLQHSAALYQALEAFSSREDAQHLSGLLAFYTRELMGSRAGVCYFIRNQSSFQGEIYDPDKIIDHTVMETKIHEIWRHINLNGGYIYRLSLNTGTQLICVPIKSLSTCFGFLGYTMDIVDDNQVYKGDHNKDGGREALISFLSGLGATVLERCKMEKLSNRLAVAEEQNRIANEIHDGVAQHLFSMVYALHALAQKSGDLQDAEVRQQLELLKNKANQAAKELRASIYRTSPLKRGDQVFTAGLDSYLKGIEKLNGVKVDFTVNGQEDTLSPALRQALYRVVCEATSNAMRHGNCTKIWVNLNMAPGKVLLQLTDNGGGFNIKQTKGGLGLTNMKNLMMSFQGRLVISSVLGAGTKLICLVPGNHSVENLCMGGDVVENYSG